MMIRMFHQRIFLTACFVFFEVTHTLPLEEKIEPVELFHHCINPSKDENELEKSPVLLLHNFLGTHKNYGGVDEVIATSTKRKVCSVDLRNHGESPWNNRTDIAALAVDIGHFLDMQNISKVNLIGESLGGKVAIHYTLNNPDRVESLVTEDIRPNGVNKRALMFLSFFIRIIKKMLETQPMEMNEKEAKEYFAHYIRDLLEKLGTAEKIPDDASKLIDVHPINGTWQPKHNMKLFYEKINNPKEVMTESSGLYTGPVLFIYGTESIFKVDEDEENILKLFPKAKMIPIEGAGHIIHENHEYRQEFDNIVVKFLNGIK